MGHVFFIKLFGYEISSITIYPFGGITKVNKDINTPLNKEIIIALGGIFFQIILFLIVFLLPLTTLTKEIFYTYNITIMLFNMLPIIPLDGSVLASSILAKFASFKSSYLINFFISLITLIVFLSYNVTSSLNNYLIISFLVFKMYEYLKNYRYIYNRFLLERYLKNYSFPNISSRKGNLSILKKDTYQYFIENGRVKSEKIKLKERFDINKNNKL